jgi:hypothetical protein
VADAHWRAEEFAEARLGQQFVARAVGDDAAIAHEDDAGDFWKYIAEVMRDHDQSRAFTSQPTQSFAQLALCGQVERVGGLVEKELLRAMHEGAGNEDTAFFSGGHCSDELLSELRRLNSFEGFTRSRTHFLGDVEIGPQCGCGKETGDYRIEAGRGGGSLAGQFGAHWSGADYAEMAAQLGQIPTLAAEDADEHSGLNDGIELAGHGENERGFAAAVRPENGDVLAGANVEIDVVQNNAIAARDVDRAHFEKGLRIDFVVAHVQMLGRPLDARLNGLD